MARRGASDDLEDDPVEDEDEEPEDRAGGQPEEEEAPPRRRPSASPRRRATGRSAGPPRPWTIEDLDRETDDVRRTKRRKGKDEDEEPGFFSRLRRPVFFRARDSWYFEPLVALALIVLLLVGLFAYTSNWPPIFVVESDSMQHGYGDTVGLINTGDLVLVQKVSPSTIVTYVEGQQTGFSTYGEYGDVILYHPNGATLATPVIHRAILYLEWDPQTGDYSAPSLAGLPCGSQPGALYSIAGSSTGCGSTGLITTITLYDVGWKGATVSIPLGGLGRYSGFITMGDNNLVAGSPPQGKTDQSWGISALVAPSWVMGVARGMIPWVGAFKLLIDGNAQEVPAQSWQFLALTISAIVLAGFGLHYLFRVEGIEDPRRREEERAERRTNDDDEEGGPVWKDRPPGSRWHGLREWLAAPDDEETEEPRAVPRKKTITAEAPSVKKGPAPAGRSRGRPKPAVRKTKGLWSRKTPKRSTRDSDDNTL